MTGQVFAGLKVADFTWAAVGPVIARYLANHGATVVRVESLTRPDVVRTVPPFRHGQTQINQGGFYAILNSNKHSLALNLNHPKGQEIARRLIAWSDVVLENFGAGVMKRWGLGYEDIINFKPDIVMISSTNLGQTGPHSSQVGYGTQLVSLAGFTHITGWAEGTPNQPFGAYTDLTAPRFGATALIAALLYHKRTGKGQYLDLSQLESSLHLLAPLFLDYFANGREASRMGNLDPSATPHGAFPCSGDDRWVAIAVETEKEWQALCQAMGQPRLANDSRFSNLPARQENAAQLEAIIARWTQQKAAHEAMEALQRAGVPAGVVQNGEDLFNDPQLRRRGYFQEREHPEMGEVSYPTPPFHLPESPAQIGRSPCLGEHTEYVCREILGMGDEEFTTLLAEGVLE